METEFDPDIIEFLFTCAISFILLMWIQFGTAQDIRQMLKLIIIKVLNLIGKCLIVVGAVGEFLINQTGSLETSSADASIKNDVGDQ